MDLKDLVPPLELCKKIPAGEFEDSALVWVGKSDFEVAPRNEKRVIPISWMRIPAPTLQEIMAELPPGDTACFCCYQGNSQWSMGDCECDLYVKNGTEDSNPATAALKVWLEMKGIE